MKFTWEQMPLCEDCHYKDANPDICRYKGQEVKPGIMLTNYDCGRYEKEIHWQRKHLAEQEFNKTKKV